MGNYDPKTLADITRLCQKLRIDAETDVVFMDVDERGRPKPTQETLDKHTRSCPAVFSTMASANNKKSSRTLRYLRVGELVAEHSAAADLVFISMPVPDVEVNPHEYMSWLNAMVPAGKPTVFIRGNQEPVLTFEL